MTSKTEASYIGLGSGIRLFEEGWYLREFGPGVSRRGFRKLCRNLGVPLIFVGKSCYVDQWVFKQAMKSVTRLGAPDFSVPGSIGQNIRSCVTKLDLEWYKRNYEQVVKELLDAQLGGGDDITKEVRLAAKKAASRMVQAGLYFYRPGARPEVARG